MKLNKKSDFTSKVFFVSHSVHSYVLKEEQVAYLVVAAIIATAMFLRVIKRTRLLIQVEEQASDRWDLTG